MAWMPVKKYCNQRESDDQQWLNNWIMQYDPICKQFCEHSEIRAFVKSDVLAENYGCVNIKNSSLQYYRVSLTKLMECLSKHSFRYNYISLAVWNHFLVILSLYTTCHSVAKPYFRVFLSITTYYHKATVISHLALVFSCIHCKTKIIFTYCNSLPLSGICLQQTRQCVELYCLSVILPEINMYCI